eukprot:10930513-Prorocentrum_lima.AAC.1
MNGCFAGAGLHPFDDDEAAAVIGGQSFQLRSCHQFCPDCLSLPCLPSSPVYFGTHAQVINSRDGM